MYSFSPSIYKKSCTKETKINIRIRSLYHLPKHNADQAVQWFGKPAAAPKVLGSNQCMDVKLSVLGPTNGWEVPRWEIGRREVPGSILGHACRPSRPEFSVVFSEIRVNTG